MSDSRLLFMAFSSLVVMALWTSLAIGSDLLSDPTRPPAAVVLPGPSRPNPAEGALDLRAIFFAEGRRVAIINDQRLHEQDRVGSARLIEIGPDRVRLRRAGEIVELRLVQRDIKNAARSTTGSTEDWGNPPASPAVEPDRDGIE